MQSEPNKDNKDNQILRRAYLMLKLDTQVQIDLLCNPLSQLECRETAKCVFKSDYDPSVYIFSVDLPDVNFLLERNSFIFEVSYCPQPLVVASYYSERFIYSPFEDSDFFLFGIKFRRNERNGPYKEPPGEAIEDPIRQLVYFFNYLSSNFVTVQNLLIKNSQQKEIFSYYNSTLYSLSDLIRQFKKYSGNILATNSKYLDDLTTFTDDLIIQAANNRNFQEGFIFLTSFLSVFAWDFFIARESTYKQAHQLLSLLSDVNEDLLMKLGVGKNKLKDALSNGLSVLINLAIKEGLPWLKIISNKSLVSLFESEVDLFKRINELIKRAGSPMRREETFQETKKYLIKFYMNNVEKFESSANVFNLVLRNVAILAVDKECLISTIIDFYGGKDFKLSEEMLKLFKDELKRKKWGSENERNFKKYILLLNDIITKEEKLKDEFKTLLYETSNNILYLSTIMKTIKIDSLLFKKAFYAIYELSLEDLCIIISDMSYYQNLGLKTDLIDLSFYEKIKSCVKRINLPFEESQKILLEILLLSDDLFPNGSLDLLKDFIKEKPKIEDLIFLCKNLIYPQRRKNSEKKFYDVWLNIRNNIMNTYVEVPDLVKSFSLIFSNLPEEDFKLSFSEEVWKTLFQKYSNEVFFSLSHMFTQEANFDTNFIETYLNLIESQIYQISQEKNILEKVNLFFSALSIYDSENEKVLFSNNIYTQKVITSLMDYLSQNTVSEELITNFIYENPSKSCFWYKIIKSFGDFLNYKSHPYYLKLVDLVGNAFMQVKSGEATISEFIHISKHKESQREALLAYFSAVGSTDSQILTDLIQSQLTILDDYLDLVHSLQVFFKDQSEHINNSQDYVNYLNSLKEQYKVTKIKDFSIRNDLLMIKEEVKLINKWSQTCIFRNVLTQNIKSKGEVLDILKECRRTEDVIKETLESLLSEDLSKLSLNQIRSLFKGLEVEVYSREVEVINFILKLPKEKIQTLTSILKTFCEVGNYIKFCQTFIKLDSLYNFGENNITLYTDYLTLSNNSDTSFDRIYKFSAKVEEIRQKYFKKKDIENILIEIAEDFELTSFLLATPEEDVRNMVDAVDEHGDSFIRVQTIRDLLIIGSFVKSLNLKDFSSNNSNSKDNPSEEEFVNRILTTLNRPSYSGIDVLMNSCSKNYLGIKHLHQELSNREEASKIKARDICIHSSFHYYFNPILSSYEVDIKYGKTDKKIHYRDLGELRDRVLLLLYNTPQGENKNKNKSDNDNELRLLSLLNSFIKTVELSEKILFNLNDIFFNGYPEQLSQKVVMQDGDYSTFESFLDSISQINSKWNDDLKEAYTKFYPLTYFNGNQFWSIESLFENTENHENTESTVSTEGLYLLKFADPLITYEKIRSKVKEGSINVLNKKERSPQERIMRLGYLINSVINPFTHSNPIPNLKKVNINLGSSHIIYACPSNMKIYTYLLSLYFSLENSLPLSNSLFYCRKDTSFHELVSFLYRFIHSPTTRLFTLIRVENLSFALQNFLVSQINKLSKNKSILADLAMICCDSMSTLHTQFSNDPSIYSLRDFDVLDDILLSEILGGLNLNAVVVRSDDSGAGKTHFIKSKFEELVKNNTSSTKNLKNLTYIDFPILDSINMNRISERLQRLFTLNGIDKSFLHITLCGIIDDYEMLDYILFSLLIVGCLKHNSYVNLRDFNNPVYIEVSNTYNDYLFNSVSVMSLLPKNEMIIASDNLNNVVYKNDIKDPLQLITNYLYNYDKDYLNETDIVPEVEMNTKIYSKDDCLHFLNKYFIKDNKLVTFRQVGIFLSVLNDQLVKFSNNYFFSCENLGYINDDNLKDIRQRIMQCLLLMTEEFTTRSIKNAREQQSMNVFKLKRSVSREDMYDEETRQEEVDSLKDILSWSSSNHLLIMFHEDGMCVTPVYREAAKVNEAVRGLAESQRQNLEDYQVFSHFELLEKLTNIVGRQFDLDALAKKQDYILTADNFLKMLLIIIRARCNVPIVIMGETGCGKTSLVRYLATEIMREGFEVINFHAGVREHHILEKIKEITERADILKVTDNKIWVFLDEINTCDCMGLITELICHKTCLGQPLPENIVFIAACNPYRIRKNLSNDVGLVKQRLMTRLVYTVHPLPEALIDFVWDYGSLSESEERLYIGNILSSISGDIKKISIEAVCQSQMFIRSVEDKYSVSLRDVARFKILHEWFYKTLLDKNQKKRTTKTKYVGSNIKFNGSLMISRKALILSLILCYLYRISKNSDRLNYKIQICKLVSITQEEMEEMINEEQRDIVLRMELPPAIAINRALLENVFTLLVCVVNKIPLFICGKPGCSKSLSIQLLVSNLRGADSEDPFFKSLPRILAIPYQGSETSTSEGIEKIFEKAYNVLRDNPSDSILPLVVFDEIGLAEISKNNPLKILHSLLEPEKASVAFVGISNWRLDASKMNRAVYLARPDPDLEDLESTAIAIFDYYNKDAHKEERQVVKALARTYFDFKKEAGINSDFHGTRDFYSLIKGCAKALNEKRDDKLNIVVNSLCRNFGGLKDSHERILSIFSKHFETKIEISLSVMDLVKANLTDRESRFLLLFSNGYSASYILDNYLSTETRDRVFMLGSEFEADKDKDEHSFRLLSDIILYMESGKSIIMKKLDQVYGSLYDLFNQNFMIVGGKKNCRIALGSTNNPMCFVNEKFHCVVIVDINDLDSVDPPFLNRFEKQILTFDAVLNKEEKSLVKELNSWISDITIVEGISININELIPNWTEDFSQALVLSNSKGNKSPEEILTICKRDILAVSSVSLIIYSILSSMYAKSRDEVLKTHKIYFEEQQHDSLGLFLKSKGNAQNKFIVYTYSNILEEISVINSSLSVSELKSEKDFDIRFKQFLNCEEESLAIKFDTKEKKHIQMIKYKVDKLMTENQRILGNKKKVLMIIYLSRKSIKSSKNDFKSTSYKTQNINNFYDDGYLSGISTLSGWESITIDALNGGQIDSLKNMLHLSTLDLIKRNLDAKMISNLVFNIYSKFSFTTYNSNDMNLVKLYIAETIHKIESDKEIFNIFYKKVNDYLEDKDLGDWKVKIFSEARILSKSSDTLSSIKAVIEGLVEEPLLKIIYFLESESSINSYFVSGSEEKTKIFRTIWTEKLMSKNLNEVYTYNVTQSLTINCVFNLLFPFSKVDIYQIASGIQEHVQKIHILDNAAYYRYQDELDQDSKLNFDNELEIIKKIVKSSSLFKTKHYDRSLELAYISDICNYFLTVEIKKEFKWKNSLDILVNKSVGYDLENIDFIFIFLWENRKFLDSLFKVFNSFEKHFGLSLIEDLLNEDALYDPLLIKRENLKTRKESHTNTFINIFNKLSQILLERLSLPDDNKDSVNYGLIINTFISSLMNISLELKNPPRVLNILVVINEFLRIMSQMHKNNKLELDKAVKQILSTKINLSESSKYSFKILENILISIDENFAELKERQKNPENFIKLNFILKLKKEIISSKLTIFENILHSFCDSQTKFIIIRNILSDEELCLYSSMIFRILIPKPKESCEDLSFILQSDIINEMDTILIENNLPMNSAICAFISDFFRKYLDQPKKEEVQTYLQQNLTNYYKFNDLASETKHGKVAKLVGYAGLKHYLDIFGRYLVDDSLEKDRDLLSKINTSLQSQDSHVEMLRNFTLKSMAAFYGGTANTLVNVNYEKLDIHWANNKLFENNDNALGIEPNLPNFEKINKEYSLFFVSLLNEENEENIQKFKNMILNASSSPEIKFIIIQFFINKIWLNFSHPKYQSSYTYGFVIKLFNKVGEVIKNSFGDVTYNFLLNLVENFKKDKHLQISPTVDTNRIGMLALSMQMLNMILSFGRNLCLGKLFFDENGILHKTLHHWNSAFLPAGFVEYSDENLLVMMKHIDENYEIYGTQIGLYECECGFLYTIGDCTRPYYVSQCPNCTKSIGGTGHVLVTGHKNLINADNRNEPGRKKWVIEHLSKKLKNNPGYIAKMADELSMHYSIRGLSSIGFRFLNFFHHSVIYLLSTLGGIEVNSLKSIIHVKGININPLDYLIKHMNTDILKLNELIKSKEWYIFHHVIFNEFLLLNKDPYRFDSAIEREKFEIAFQTKIIAPKLDKLAGSISDYKLFFNNEKKLTYSSIINENFSEEEIMTLNNSQLFRVFRYSRLGDWEDLKIEFIKKKVPYQFLKLLIEKFDDLDNLSLCLLPILEFTNFMLDKCNFKISRGEAKEKKIRDLVEGDIQAENLFIKFAMAWEKIAYKATQWQCKSLPVIENFRLDLPLSFVLIDDRELGYGMYMAAALQHLGKIQNEILEAIVYLIKENNDYQIWGNMDTNKYSIQKVSPHELIVCESNVLLNMTRTFAKFYDIFNPNYGQGSIIEYNFEKIENDLAYMLLTNKKFLDYENLTKIQYKFELLSIQGKNGNLLSEIKGKLDSQNFSEEETREVNKVLEKIESQNLSILHSIFSSLEILLCNIRYTTDNINNQEKLADYINITAYNTAKFKGAEKISEFLKQDRLGEIKLINLLNLYELIEERLFKYMVDYISPEYNTSLDEITERKIQTFLDESNIIMTDLLVKVCQRFIFRCLVSSIEAKFPIKEYLMRLDFWNSGTSEETMDRFYMEFPDEVLIKHTLSLYRLLLDCSSYKSIDLSEKMRREDFFKENKFN